MAAPRTFREVVRTVTVSYPVPFVVACLVAAGLICFGLAATARDSLAWIIAGTGAITLLSACGMAAYAVLRRPDLLRSERFSLLNRYFDALSDSDIDKEVRDRIGRVIEGFAEPGPKKQLGRAEPPRPGREDSDE